MISFLPSKKTLAITTVAVALATATSFWFSAGKPPRSSPSTVAVPAQMPSKPSLSSDPAPMSSAASSPYQTWLTQAEHLRSQLKQGSELDPILTQMRSHLQNASPGALLALAKSVEFSDDDRPLLHATAFQFGQSISPATIAALAHEYAAASSDTARSQLASLTRFIAAPEALDALEAVVRQPPVPSSATIDPLVSSASFAIASSQEPARIDRLIGYAVSRSGTAQLSVLDGFSAIRSPAVIPLITSILDGSHPLSADNSANQVAVRLLGQIKDEQSRDLLQQLTTNPSAEVSAWAQEAADQLRTSAPALFAEAPAQP